MSDTSLTFIHDAGKIMTLKLNRRSTNRIYSSVLIFALIVLPIRLATQRSQAALTGKIATKSFSPHLKAFLDTIAWAEGTADANGYRMKFGGGFFYDYSKHPDHCISFSNTCSTAAGRYQFLTTTWERLQKELRLPNFSPHYQDLAAKRLIEEEGALRDVEAGRFETAVYKVANVWASFPTEAGVSAYDQPSQPIGKLRSVYKAILAHYQKQSPYVEPLLRSCDTVLFGRCSDSGKPTTRVLPTPQRSEYPNRRNDYDSEDVCPRGRGLIGLCRR